MMTGFIHGFSSFIGAGWQEMVVLENFTMETTIVYKRIETTVIKLSMVGRRLYKSRKFDRTPRFGKGSSFQIWLFWLSISIRFKVDDKSSSLCHPFGGIAHKKSE